MDDTQRLDEIRALADQIRERDRLNAIDKAALYGLIPQVFPEKRGEPKVRGRLNEVVDASGLTREYVARIRDGKVKP
ncbi:MAG TPA: hypothetical protein VFH77_07950 [Streptomyces sp.]|nr:hypothetical protein [Streptomyces sp.]